MKSVATTICRFVHTHLLWCLISVYALGALWPELGRWVRGVPVSGAPGGWLLKIMLGMLLLNAGLGLDTKHLVRLTRRWRILLAAVVVSVAVPGCFVLALSWVVGTCEIADRAQATLIGLAIVAAMPTAGSSTAWSQNAEGDMALTLGLVLGTTLIGPFTVILVPLIAMQLLDVQLIAGMASATSQAAAVFLTLWVLLPALAGMVLRQWFGTERIERVKPYLKCINLANLLLLNYANASLSLPAMVTNPQPVQLAYVVLATISVALVAFPAAGILARVYRVDAPQRASLYFGIGMKNNGAGLVLVSTAFPVPGPILLPIILYNIVQHLAAAIIDRFVLPAHGQLTSETEAQSHASRPETESGSQVMLSSEARTP